VYTECGAGVWFFGAGVCRFGAGAILGGEPAPLESVEWHFAAQALAIKTHLRHLGWACAKSRDTCAKWNLTPFCTCGNFLYFCVL